MVRMGPATPSGSPVWEQRTKHLDHLLLLSQMWQDRQLDWQWSSQDCNRILYTQLASKAGGGLMHRAVVAALMIVPSVNVMKPPLWGQVSLLLGVTLTVYFQGHTIQGYL